MLSSTRYFYKNGANDLIYSKDSGENWAKVIFYSFFKNYSAYET